MWKVNIKPQTELELKRSLKNGEFSSDDIKLLLIWIKFIEVFGPYELEKDFKWDDHSLWGKWSGYRSSCFSGAGRIIYKILDDEIIVMVVRVTNKHDYK